MQSSTPISNPIDIFPKNVEFQKNLISIGDETPSDDIGEQEEISRKRKGKSVGCKDSQATPDTQQSKKTEDEPYKKKPRKKNSACWEFLDIVVEGVNKWAVCKLCKTRMTKTPTTGTTTFNRHVDKCKIKHGLSKQPQLQFQSEKLSERSQIFSLRSTVVFVVAGLKGCKVECNLIYWFLLLADDVGI
ncbi:hypothetical protein POM88_033522 [Heracleum sosnowskyi]|uniref:BED-type domain-containing protein n=1 Tax=Heracleum sosnowskyi TaxID=360622 RepID=A0AAD8MLZ2_9APIA|nr:hypothetical protein POM88_033522 [Heracleum sosnowskyi]